MSFIGQRDIMLEIARGKIAGQSGVNKFGRSTDVDNGIATDLWDRANTTDLQKISTAPTTARTHDIASTSTDDDGAPVGTGARTIRVFGLTDWGTAEVSEDLIMDGTTNVPTANAYVIIHRMVILTKGSAGPNLGKITATAQIDGTVTAQINVGQGQTQMAILGIPSVQKGYLTRYYASFEKSGGAVGAIDIDLLVNPEPDVELTTFVTKHTQSILSTGSSHVENPFKPYREVPGPAILKVQGTGSANDLDVSGGFDLILVDN